MRERFLRKCDIAAMFGTNPDMAAMLLRERGVYPVDFGRGRGRGLRWLESAVSEAMRMMHTGAQPAPKKPRPQKPPAIPKAALADLSLGNVQALVSTQTTH